LPFLIVGGFLADLISKTKSKGEVYINGLLTILYIAVIYFFVIVVGLLLIYYGLWEHPALVQNLFKIIEPVVVVAAISFLPVLGGGYLSYGLRKFSKRKKNNS
jgi:hypothetical protein